MEQLAGRWRVKDAKLAPLHEAAIARLRRFRRWSARHVPRSQNATADALANEALDRVAAGGPAVVVRRPDIAARPDEGPAQLGLDFDDRPGSLPPAGRSSAKATGQAEPPLPSPADPAARAAPVARAPRSSVERAARTPAAAPAPALEPGFDPGDAGPGAGALRVRILGSGTSQGIPRIACDCPVCTSDDRRDRRLRASALLGWGDHNVLIECGPDFRQQALAAGLRRLDAVLLTHEHQDAVGGLDELRRFNELGMRVVPIHARTELLPLVIARFPYAFDPAAVEMPGIPRLRPVAVAGPFEIGGRTFVPIPVYHGRRLVAGYRTGGFAYCSDVSRIDADGRALLGGLDTLVISALRYEPHPGHQTVGEALALIEDLQPRRAFLTHLDHELGHAALSAGLPPGVGIAYDGFELEVDG